MLKVYIMGALKNPNIPQIGNIIREAGFDVFDDWHAPGPQADEYWQAYERARGRDFVTAINGHVATNAFNFDFRHLIASDIGVLVLPCGRSAHLELGWMIGQGKRAYVLYDDPSRWDLMYKFAHGIFYDVDALVAELKAYVSPAISVSGPNSTFYQQSVTTGPR